jgi:hypothetical protein
MVMRDPPCRSDKGSSHRDHLVLARTKGERYPCAGASTRTKRMRIYWETPMNESRPPPIYVKGYTVDWNTTQSNLSIQSTLFALFFNALGVGVI